MCVVEGKSQVVEWFKNHRKMQISSKRGRETAYFGGVGECPSSKSQPLTRGGCPPKSAMPTVRFSAFKYGKKYFWFRPLVGATFGRNWSEMRKQIDPQTPPCRAVSKVRQLKLTK
jgi:hypothetical protein